MGLAVLHSCPKTIQKRATESCGSGGREPRKRAWWQAFVVVRCRTLVVAARLAMQKVEGSSPFIRSQEPLESVGESSVPSAPPTVPKPSRSARSAGMPREPAALREAEDRCLEWRARLEGCGEWGDGRASERDSTTQHECYFWSEAEPFHEHSFRFEWRGSWREAAVVGVCFVARGNGDQGRLCERPAHELEADREAIRGEPSRYDHGGKATIRG